jgi:hypothetical protein
MRRRDFVTLIGGAVAAWPLAARAQQPPTPVVGFLRSTTAAGSVHLVGAFRQGLNEAGFVEGQNLAVEYRWADDQGDRIPGMAAELVRRQVAVIVALRYQLSRRRPRRFQLSSPPASIRSEQAWSPASAGPAATSPAWSLPLLIWRPSSWGCCTNSFQRLPSSRCWGTRTNRNSRLSCEKSRQQVAPSGGKS